MDQAEQLTFSRIAIKHNKNGTILKKIYLGNHLITSYPSAPNPEKLKFQSPMVNDFNQDLCGGWCCPELRNDIEALFERIKRGLKPFANLSTWAINKVKVKELDEIINVMPSNLKYKRFDRFRNQDGSCSAFGKEMHDYVDNIDICMPGKLSDLFDMDALAEDYTIHLPKYPQIAQDIKNSKHLEMEQFLGDKWDDLGWLTGLILGYPIENTISRYKQGSWAVLSDETRLEA